MDEHAQNVVDNCRIVEDAILYVPLTASVFSVGVAIENEPLRTKLQQAFERTDLNFIELAFYGKDTKPKVESQYVINRSIVLETKTSALKNGIRDSLLCQTGFDLVTLFKDFTVLYIFKPLEDNRGLTGFLKQDNVLRGTLSRHMNGDGFKCITVCTCRMSGGRLVPSVIEVIKLTPGLLAS